MAWKQRAVGCRARVHEAPCICGVYTLALQGFLYFIHFALKGFLYNISHFKGFLFNIGHFALEGFLYNMGPRGMLEFQLLPGRLPDELGRVLGSSDSFHIEG